MQGQHFLAGNMTSGFHQVAAVLVDAGFPRRNLEAWFPRINLATTPRGPHSEQAMTAALLFLEQRGEFDLLCALQRRIGQVMYYRARARARALQPQPVKRRYHRSRLPEE